MIALVADDVRALARLAGLEIRDEDARPIAERLTTTLALLAAVPDELLADVEPAFVLPMTTPPFAPLVPATQMSRPHSCTISSTSGASSRSTSLAERLVTSCGSAGVA